MCCVAFHQPHREESLTLCSSRTLEAQCGILSTKKNARPSSSTANIPACLLLLFVCLADLIITEKWSTPSELHTSSHIFWQQCFNYVFIEERHSAACTRKILREGLKHLMWKELTELHIPEGLRMIKHVRLSENQSASHFFSLASWIPVTELPVHHRDRSRPETERDANLSWHVKLWLDQITKLSTINGWAERLSLHTEGCTGFVYRQKPVTLPVSIMQSLIDKIISRFQSHISSELAFAHFIQASVCSSSLEPSVKKRYCLERNSWDFINCKENNKHLTVWFSPEKVFWIKSPQIVKLISPSD